MASHPRCDLRVCRVVITVTDRAGACRSPRRYCNYCTQLRKRGGPSMQRQVTCALCGEAGGALLASDVANTWVHPICASLLPETVIVSAAAQQLPSATRAALRCRASRSRTLRRVASRAEGRQGSPPRVSVHQALHHAGECLRWRRGAVAALAPSPNTLDVAAPLQTCVVCKKRGTGACVQCFSLHCRVAFHPVRSCCAH
jgi:hypothetical protein